MNNPLSAASPQVQSPSGMHPLKAHATIWQHVGNMPAEDMPDKVSSLAHCLPILAALAHNPGVTRKDVIKAAADAAGAGKLPPSQAVDIISGMPTDPDKLQPWLKGLYAYNLAAVVHMKAAMMAPVPLVSTVPGGAPQQPQPAGLPQ